MTPTATSYTISKDLTGYTNNQTINPSELNLWRVIKKNSDGTVDIVSDKVSSKLVYFKGKTGYVSLAGGLNTIAAQYTDGKHVASTRHMGYGNQTSIITNTFIIDSKTEVWAVSTGDPLSSADCGGYNLCDTQEGIGGGDTLYNKDRALVQSVYGSLCVPYNDTGTLCYPYWLSSRRYQRSGAGIRSFQGRYVNSKGNMSAQNLYWFSDGVFTLKYEKYSIRPIVSLKATSELTEGEGTSSYPYQLK